MNVDFRQRSFSEILEMFSRRKWLILLPVITMTAAVGYVVKQLPSVYESKTTLAVKAPQVAASVVNQDPNSDLTRRMESINASVLSRSELEPMIAKYNLFELERQRGMATELIIDKMINTIKIELQKTDENKVASFEIRYRDRTPKAARDVTSELANKYVSAQVTNATETAKTTEEFLDNEVNKKKEELDTLEKQRLDIMSANVETLPESAQGLIAQLRGLRQSEGDIRKEIQSLGVEKGRARDRISALNRQISTIEEFGKKEIESNISRGADYKSSPAYGRLIESRAKTEAEIEKLTKEYREKMPIVIDARARLAKINKEIAEMEKHAKKVVADVKVSSNRKAEMQKQRLEIEKEKEKGQISLLDGQIEAKNSLLRQNASQIAVLETKINTIPSVKVLLESINSRYQSAKEAYDDLMKKKNSAQLQVSRDSKAQGETIRVVDPANLPTSPVAPKRGMLTIIGGILGLALGIFLGAIFEIPRLFKIQNVEDAKHYTGLPLLASVPPLLTHSEISWQKRSYWLKILAGITIAIGSIPVIIMVLQASRIFDRLVS